MNLRRVIPGRKFTPDAFAEIERVKQIWRDCRERYGGGGSFLFGDFTVADAMYAPVATRFRTYEVTLDPQCQAYADAILNLPAVRAWIEAALKETIVIPQFEYEPGGSILAPAS